MNKTEVYITLFSSSFISSTLLPGHSELILTAFIYSNKFPVLILILVASLGNTTGTSGAASLHDHSPHRGKEYNAHNHCGGHDADWHLSTMAQTRIASIWDDEITSSNANLKAA